MIRPAGTAGPRSLAVEPEPRPTRRGPDRRAPDDLAPAGRGGDLTEEVRDDSNQQALIDEANRLYGRRPGGGAMSAPASSPHKVHRDASSRRSARRIPTGRIVVSPPDGRHARQDAARRHDRPGDARRRARTSRRPSSSPTSTRCARHSSTASPGTGGRADLSEHAARRSAEGA